MANPVRKAPPPPPLRKGAVLTFQALYSYKGQKEDELSFEEGDLMYVIDQSNPDWWLARLDAKEGLIPSNFVSNDNMPMPIIDAARRGNLAVLNDCLQNGVSPNSLDKTGSSPLHSACLSGHFFCVETLLKEPKVEINLQNKLGDTPLHNAARKGHASVVELLLQSGAKMDIFNMENQMPRDLATGTSVIGLFDDILVSSLRRTSHPDQDYLNEHEDSDEDN